MPSGRRISAADALADAVRTTLGSAMPLDLRGRLVQALSAYDRATGYTNRLGCRQRRTRAKQRATPAGVGRSGPAA